MTLSRFHTLFWCFHCLFVCLFCQSNTSPLFIKTKKYIYWYYANINSVVFPILPDSNWILNILTYTCSKSSIEMWNRNLKKCEIYSKLTVKIPERHNCRGSGVSIADFEHISHLFLELYCWFWTSECWLGTCFAGVWRKSRGSCTP